MKLTDPELIQKSEKEFIDTINAELDWDAIETLLMEKHGFVLQDEVNYTHGDLVVFDNQIAYQFDFEIKVPLSVIFNRQGECLTLSTQKGEPPEPAAVENLEDLKDRGTQKVEQLAASIADMIGEINREDGPS
jgi:hypothetical protein